jgi:hypothetical protein
MAFRLLAVAALILAVAHAQITVSWSDCGSTTGAIGKVTDVEWTPQNPTAGENVTIVATVSFAGTVTALHGDLEFLDGIIQNHFNGCKGATIQAPLGLATITFPPAGCPVSGPSHKFTRYVKTSPLLPAGSTESILKVTEQGGKPLICCAVKLSNA